MPLVHQSSLQTKRMLYCCMWTYLLWGIAWCRLRGQGSLISSRPSILFSLTRQANKLSADLSGSNCCCCCFLVFFMKAFMLLLYEIEGSSTKLFLLTWTVNQRIYVFLYRLFSDESASLYQTCSLTPFQTYSLHPPYISVWDLHRHFFEISKFSTFFLRISSFLVLTVPTELWRQ